jgi:hypothetical protein
MVGVVGEVDRMQISFRPTTVADILGDGDEVVVGVVA